MQLRLAKFHSIETFEQLVGIERVGPGGIGDTISTWRLKPGEYPRGYGLQPWGGKGVVSMLWDPARPVAWDVDLNNGSDGGVVVFCSGFLMEDGDGWWYYEPPGSEPLLIAGLLRNGVMSVVLRTNERVPALLPGHLIERWIHCQGRLEQLATALPPVERSWFRARPIQDPHNASDNTEELVAPLL